MHINTQTPALPNARLHTNTDTQLGCKWTQTQRPAGQPEFRNGARRCTEEAQLPPWTRLPHASLLGPPPTLHPLPQSHLLPPSRCEFPSSFSSTLLCWTPYQPTNTCTVTFPSTRATSLPEAPTQAAALQPIPPPSFLSVPIALVFGTTGRSHSSSTMKSEAH